MRIDRRQFVLGVMYSGSASTLFVGCGGSKSDSNGIASAHTPPKPTEVSLMFAETDEFYKELTDAIGNKDLQNNKLPNLLLME
jgi:hypothetical protein